MEPTIVTSSPSSTQATPSAITTRQCQGDHGSRSSRAGTVLYVTTESTIAEQARRASPCPPLLQAVVRQPHDTASKSVWRRRACDTAPLELQNPLTTQPSRCPKYLDSPQ